MLSTCSIDAQCLYNLGKIPIHTPNIHFTLPMMVNEWDCKPIDFGGQISHFCSKTARSHFCTCQETLQCRAVHLYLGPKQTHCFFQSQPRYVSIHTTLELLSVQLHQDFVCISKETNVSCLVIIICRGHSKKTCLIIRKSHLYRRTLI